MKWLSFLATLAVLLVPIDGARPQSNTAEPRRGDVYELALTRDMAQHDNRGGTGSSHDRDTLIERVIESRADGVVLEYTLPKQATPQHPSNWYFPAQVFRPTFGPPKLLNRAELEARIDSWLTNGGKTRAACGELVFTWTAFRIDCDPQSLTGILQRFELSPTEIREGASYLDPNASAPARLTRGSSGLTLVAEMVVDPETVRRARAEADVGVAQIMSKSLTLEDALRERAKDTVSGTISVTFETSPAGDVRRRTTVTNLEVGRPDGQQETQTTKEILERRLVSPRSSLPA